MEIKAIYSHTKIKVAPPHFFNTSIVEYHDSVGEIFSEEKGE